MLENHIEYTTLLPRFRTPIGGRGCDENAL